MLPLASKQINPALNRTVCGCRVKRNVSLQTFCTASSDLPLVVSLFLPTVQVSCPVEEPADSQVIFLLQRQNVQSKYNRNSYREMKMEEWLHAST